MKSSVWPLLAALLLAGFALPPGRNLPPPLRVFIPFEAAWRGVHDSFEQQELQIVREDRGRGYVISEFKEYMSGGLTNRYIAKIGEPQATTDGDFIKVEYQYEVLVVFVEARQVLVTINANIRALKRNFLGEQTWQEIPTNGRLEEDLLTTFGKGLFGQTFVLAEPKKGFWEQDPTYLPDPSLRIPKVAGPERP